jgi:hypothetical protein
MGLYRWIDHFEAEAFCWRGRFRIRIRPRKKKIIKFKKAVPDPGPAVRCVDPFLVRYFGFKWAARLIY